MATDFNYLKLSVVAFKEGSYSTVYSYPTADDSSRWAPQDFNPADVIKNFLNARECYLLSASEKGHYFTLIARNPLDAAGSYVALTLLMDNGFSLAGRQIVNALVSLKKTLVEDKDCFDDAVTRCLQAVGIPERGVKLESWRFRPDNTPGVVKTPLAYRTYVSGTELETILSFPEQPDYSRFDSVIAISATASKRPGAHINRITTPVKKMYSVIVPQGVVPSKSVVTEGERLTLSYTKEGFAPRRQNVIVGAPSPYVRYEGSAIRVKSASECGMGFVRRVRLVVKSTTGAPVHSYTLNVNGRPVDTMEPFITLNEHEMAPGNKTEINVASNNYTPLRVVKDSAELVGLETLELELSPMEQGIILRLDFGDGRVVEQELTIEKNTPEYSQLHAGSFHGFKARREAGAGEVYHVDMRSSSKPVAPAFENVTSKEEPQHRHTPPVFENVTKGHREERAGRHEERRDDRRDRRDRDDRRDRRDGEERPSTLSDYKSRFLEVFSGNSMSQNGKATAYMLAAALVVILLVVAIVFVLPGGEGKSADNPSDTIAEAYSGDPAAITADAAGTNADANGAAATTANTTATAASSSAEKEDLQYLNDNATWERAKLKSPKYQALFDAMKAGNIQQIAENEYFAVSGNATNKEAIKCVEMLWASLGTPNQGGNQRALANNINDTRVNIHALYEDLARNKPVEPNKSPRPKK